MKRYCVHFIIKFTFFSSVLSFTKLHFNLDFISVCLSFFLVLFFRLFYQFSFFSATEAKLAMKYCIYFLETRNVYICVEWRIVVMEMCGFIDGPILSLKEEPTFSIKEVKTNQPWSKV